MKKFVATIVVRRAEVEESGKIYVVDFGSGRIEKEIPFILPVVDHEYPNPRGGLRGYRGLAFSNGRFYVANFDSILIFDKRFELLERFSHPFLSDIHDVMIEDNFLYVVSTFAEAILRIDLDGNECLPKVFWEGCDKLNDRIDYRYIEQPLEGHHHYNNVLKHSNGDFYVLACYDSSLINITQKRRHRFDSLISPHDLLEHEDRIVMNNTNGSQVVSVRPDGTDLIVEYQEERIEKDSGNENVGVNYGWLRGLCSDEENYYVGTSPASIKVIDAHKRILKNEIVLSDDVEESVFSLKLMEEFV